MLNDFSAQEFWWSSFFPGLMIIILTVGLSFLGEGLNDIINPVFEKGEKPERRPSSKRMDCQSTI